MIPPIRYRMSEKSLGSASPENLHQFDKNHELLGLMRDRRPMPMKTMIKIHTFLALPKDVIDVY
jgi:hypothetical protein